MEYAYIGTRIPGGYKIPVGQGYIIIRDDDPRLIKTRGPDPTAIFLNKPVPGPKDKIYE